MPGPPDLTGLVAGASELARTFVASSSDAVEEPIRSEMFGPERMEQHARSLAAAQPVGRAGGTDGFFPRINRNAHVLRRVHGLIGSYSRAGQAVSPAAEWLLDNFHLVEAQLLEIRDGLPRDYYRKLPKLVSEPLRGLPRIYGIAWAYVAHTDSDFDLGLLRRFVAAYQEVDELEIGELWALPTTLRAVLIENLRRIAERIAANKAARQLADICCDKAASLDPATIAQAAASTEERGVLHAFLAQLHQRLHHADTRQYANVREWLRRSAVDPAQALAETHTRQTVANVTVRNIMTSLRRIGGADWKSFIESLCTVDRVFAGTPAFREDDFDTRDECRHAVEALARRGRISERSVAEAVVALTRLPDGTPLETHPAYFLIGPGQAELARALRLPPAFLHRLTGAPAGLRLALYLGVVAGVTAAIVMAALHGAPAAEGWTLVAIALLLAFPASEAALGLVNRVVSESARPRRLPRKDFTLGIPPEARVIVVIPALLTSADGAERLARRLEMHHLSNPDPEAQFALLTDFADSPAAATGEDAALLAAARRAVEGLNARHPAPDHARFLLLHRPRTWNEREGCWMGWERKRGKLEELVRLLAGEATAPFAPLGALSTPRPRIRYVLTLDSDTVTGPRAVRELVAIASHPLNAAIRGTSRRRIAAGYGILQPRVVPPLPTPGERTPYHWLFAGQCGIDPYSATTSEIYQDLFGIGSFTGKGLLDVAVMHDTLDRRVPDDTLLSHDLFEGSIARCGFVSDVILMEDAPSHAEVAAARLHRWTRGDWQLLPFLFRAWRYDLDALAQWKIADNLRRSLIAPASLAALCVALVTGVPPVAHALAVVVAAFATGPVLGALAGLSPSRDGLALPHFLRVALRDLARAFCGALWQCAMLGYQAWLMTDAIVRTWVRLVRRRRLLQWTTAAQVQASAGRQLRYFFRRHRVSMLAGAGVAAVVASLGTANAATAAAAAALFVVLEASAVWSWLASRPLVADGARELGADDRAYLREVARDTWRYFERYVGPADHHLPPDNVQLDPHLIVAHRTSPTNIGLYLLCCGVARELGFIGTRDMLARVEATLATVESLRSHDGHLLNWYDSSSLAPLAPAYVSTVDSGNLAGHLWALAGACRAAAAAPRAPAAAAEVLRARARLDRAWAAGGRGFSRDGALVSAHAGIVSLDALAALGERGSALLASAREELASDGVRQHAPADAQAAAADFIATLESHALDLFAAADDAVEPRLAALAARADALAARMRFGFLYDTERDLFHIGYRVDKAELDGGYYDLLASEARLSSYIAICNGEVPLRHWFTLGRPFVAIGAQVTLRSWSGSMFEYLMPSLVMDEPRGGILHGALAVAVDEQIRHGRSLRVPWGISESAYGAQDHTLAYQYSGFGVPSLALKRSAGDEIVIAPYASALGALVHPAAAAANLRALERLDAREVCGFVDAIDFTPRRQAHDRRHRLVRSFMAHHQAMSLVALGDVLCDGAARRWFHANAAVAAYDALLQERVPREITPAAQPVPARDAADLPRSRGGYSRTQDDRAARDGAHGHVLSNGRYSVLLFGNGVGWSRFEGLAVTRWRDDALRHVGGTLVYLREGTDRTLRSLTAAPAPAAGATYRTTFSADRVVYESESEATETTMTVLVSPEDDIEIRDVVVHNLTDTAAVHELVSYLEPVLATQAADDAHPAFSNLFVAQRADPGHHALLFERRPRTERDVSVHLAHFVVPIEGVIGEVGGETDRRLFIGRNRDLAAPAALLRDGPPIGSAAAGLDPIAALRVRVRVPPQGRARVLFATAAAKSDATLWGHIDKYWSSANYERASLMSATLADIRLRELAIEPAEYAALQALTPLVCRVSGGGDGVPAVPFRRQHLWRHGISGDRPIIVVAISSVVGLGLLRVVLRAREYWAFAGIAVDVVILNGEPSSYAQPVADAISPLVTAMMGAPGGAADNARTVFVLRPDEVTGIERLALLAEARMVFDADGRPFEHHVQEALRKRSRDEPAATLEPVLSPPPEDGVSVRAARGEFHAATGEFVVDVGPERRPARPWINVIANADFGCQVSEAGAGFTWAGNSRLHQLTGWSNDPVRDPASEWFVLDEPATRGRWPLLGPQPPLPGLPARVRHGQGYTTFEQDADGIHVEATCFVAADAAVKCTIIRLRNDGRAPRNVRVLGVAEWVLGATRADRRYVVTRKSTEAPCLFASRSEHSEPWAGSAAFLAVQDAAAADWTCDRRELYANGARVRPATRLAGREGAGLDPCAALRVARTLAPGATQKVVFLLGFGADDAAARALAADWMGRDADEALAAARRTWKDRLSGLEVRTPDPLFDALVNHWLPYQTLACRLWARAGFYQVGGAYGFRDQLQDAMGLALIEPALLRQQVLLHASRQFREGDVQHWWHPPAGAGVRTRFTDDRLWLPFACAHYVEITGDAAVLDAEVPWLEGAAVPPHAEDAYYLPHVTDDQETLYEHGARAIDVSLAVGAHGLPLMGAGDWNDGMNRVGGGGRGESVWLAWFLCAVIDRYRPLARRRGDDARVARWDQAQAALRGALHTHGWDGEWYRRAYFDDGTPLGSNTNAQCRIDLIAQAWAVLSGAAEPDRARRAMRAAAMHLVDDDAHLVRLLDPPFADPDHDPGYIKDYPPGVRENGGQYAHAGAWAVMAFAALGEHDAAYRAFTYLSPAHRAAAEGRDARYELEPYAMAGDVYTAPPFVGRGGWSWYTGAAAWMYRAAVEAILGLTLRGDVAIVAPRLPAHWPVAEITYRHGASRYTFVCTPDDALAGDCERAHAAGEAIALVDDGRAHRLRITPVTETMAAPPATATLA